MYVPQSKIDMTIPVDIKKLYHYVCTIEPDWHDYFWWHHYVCTTEPDWHGNSWWHITMYISQSQIDMAIPGDISLCMYHRARLTWLLLVTYHYVCTIEPDWHVYSMKHLHHIQLYTPQCTYTLPCVQREGRRLEKVWENWHLGRIERIKYLSKAAAWAVSCFPWLAINLILLITRQPPDQRRPNCEPTSQTLACCWADTEPRVNAR